MDTRGRFGPKSLDDYYKGQCHENDVELLLNGCQLWKVPLSGKYKIICCGAQGGDTKYYNLMKASAYGGKGAQVGGVIKLEKNDQILMLVGQQGRGFVKRNGTAAAGGGATFCCKL